MPDTPLRIPSAETLAAWHAGEMTDEQLCEMEALHAALDEARPGWRDEGKEPGNG